MCSKNCFQLSVSQFRENACILWKAILKVNFIFSQYYQSQSLYIFRPKVFPGVRELNGDGNETAEKRNSSRFDQM